VVEHLVSAKRCRTLFATHYHSLVQDWSLDPRVRLGHMDCLVQGGDDGSTTGGAQEAPRKEMTTEEVTFLYKLSNGSSPRSYGINVARLAGLPVAVIELALRQSRQFEENMQKNADNSSSNSNDTEDAASTGVPALRGELVSTLFERMVSIATSTSSTKELAYVASEMWRQLKSESTQ
jgi:DNA mismatch repair ATPase MutS